MERICAYKISKNLLCQYNAEVKIDNSFGSITVSTWDEDKIDIDITIKVSGNK
jgi:pectin methylesterase-like acyl-CoA thioesterase